MRPWRRCINVGIDSHGKRRSKISARVLRYNGSYDDKNRGCDRSRGRMSQLARVMERRNISFESSSFLISVNGPMQ